MHEHARTCNHTHAHTCSSASHIRTLLSQLPLTIHLPSREHTTLLTAPVWPSSTLTRCPVATSHTHTVLSSLPLTMNLSSGDSDTLLTQSVCPRSVCITVALSPSRRHTMMVLSPPLLTSKLASLLPHATPLAPPLWPLKGCVACVPPTTSHTRTVLSSPPLATSLLSGDHATQ